MAWGGRGANFQGKGWLFREGAVPSTGIGFVLCPREVVLGRETASSLGRLAPSQGVADGRGMLPQLKVQLDEGDRPWLTPG